MQYLECSLWLRSLLIAAGLILSWDPFVGMAQETTPAVSVSEGTTAIDQLLTDMRIKDSTRLVVEQYRDMARKAENWQKVFSDNTNSAEQTKVSRFKSAIEQVFQFDDFYQEVREYISKNAPAIDLGSSLKAARSPAFQKMLQEENRFGEDVAKENEEFQVYYVRLQNAPPDKDRFSLMQRYEQASEMGRFMSDVQASMKLDFLKGYVAAMPAGDQRKKRWDESKAKMEVLRERAAIFKEMSQYQSLYALFLYQSLSTDEINEVIAYYESAEGQTVNKLFNDALKEVLKKRFFALGRRFGEMERPEKHLEPVNN